jgi:hypothetical protein
MTSVMTTSPRRTATVEPKAAKVVTTAPVQINTALDTTELIGYLGRGITESRMLREFIHNSLQACHEQQGRSQHSGASQYMPKIAMTRIVRNGVGKLALVDNGCGMTTRDLKNLIGALFSSGASVGDARFGLGAKIAGLKFNPVGLEYTTKTKGGKWIRNTIGRDSDGTYGWLGNFKTVQPEGLLTTYDHGTMVVLLGSTPTEETWNVTGTTVKAATHFINSLYHTIPDGYSVKGLEQRKLTGPGDFATGGLQTCKGKKVILDTTVRDHGPLKAASGTVRAANAVIDWYYCEGDSKAHDRDSIIRRFVGVCHEDTSVPGLSEFYTTYTDTAATAKLQLFGLGRISQHMALVITPADGKPSICRTKLLVGVDGNQELNWKQLAEGFKKSFPKELKNFDDAAATAENGSNPGSDLIAKMRHLRLLGADPANSKPAHGSLNSPGGHGAKPQTAAASKGSNGSAGSASRGNKAASRGGGLGHGPGGYAHPQGGTNNGTGTSQGPIQPPEVKKLTGGDVSAEMKNFFACYDKESNLLQVNLDFYWIEKEVTAILTSVELTKSRTVSPENDRVQVKEVVIQKMIERAMEAILLAKANLSKLKDDAFDTDRTCTPQMLSVFAQSTQNGWRDTVDAANTALTGK